jgi:flagellar biosynthetic protein FliO
MEVIDQVAAVLAVLLVMAGVAWFLRRRGLLQLATPRESTRKRLESLERLQLAPQHTLHLVRVGNRALLLSATSSSCTLLDSFEARVLERAGEAVP